MTNRIKAMFSTSTLRLAMFCGLATVTLAGALATPAYADNDHDNRDKRWNQSRREQPRYEGYYGQPNVYYSAPPVVYAPPGALFNLNIR